MPATDILEAALAAAKRAGADAADAVLVERESLALAWRHGALESLERKESAELGVRVLLGRRVATTSTSRLEPGPVAEAVADAVAAARLLPEDPGAGLAEVGDLARAPFPDLDLVDPTEPTIEELSRAAAAVEDAARVVAGVTNTDDASAAWSRTRLTLAGTNGFRGSYARTRHGLGVTALAGAGTAMQRDYEFRQASHSTDLPTAEAIGRRAGERAVRRLAPQKLASAVMPVVFEPRAAASLLRHLAGAASGEAVAAGRSFLKERLGQRVMAAGVAVLDDPYRRRGLASRPFDGEGVAGRPRHLVEDGVLATWLLDLGAGRRLGLSSTGHASRGGAALGSPGPTNLHLAAGKVAPEALIGDIREGLYVTELIGMGVNQVTGDYSRGAAGLLIRNGEIGPAVDEVTVAGNLADMLARLVPAADLELRGTTDAPTVRVDGLMVGGR